MQQIYRRTPLPKCDFNKVAKQLCWNRTSAWLFSCKFVACFQNTSGRLLLLISCSYNPNRENIKNHLRTLSKSLALYSSSYENLMIMGDFNVCMEEISMSGFCDTFGLKSLTKEATWCQNLENPSSIDLILTNNPRPSRQLHVQS